MAIILENCTSLSIGIFREALAAPGDTVTGSIRWSVEEEETGSIGYRMIKNLESPLLLLDYTVSGKDAAQVVDLVAVPSNLQRGQYWIFLCPVSGRRCKKLHLIRGQFQHRTAVPSVFYRQQARARFWLSYYLDTCEVMEELLKAAEAPYFREYYRGKLTRRASRMLRKFEKLKPFIEDRHTGWPMIEGRR